MNKLKTMTIKELCDTFKATTTNNDSHIYTVRGWIMDELEQRNAKAFDAWIDSDDVALMDDPSAFFEVA